MAPITLTVEAPAAWTMHQTIINIVESAIRPSSTDGHDPVLAAARAIDALFPDWCIDEGRSMSAETFLTCFWECFPGFARQMPYGSVEADPLVQLVKAPKMEVPPRPIKAEDSDGSSTLWGELPFLAGALEENLGPLRPIKWADGSILKVPNERDPLPGCPREPAERQRNLNHYAFCARLSGQRLISGMDWLGISSIASALEGVMKPIRGSPDLVDPDPRSVPELPFQIARAAFWIAHAGYLWYGREEELPGVVDGEPLWKQEMKPGKLHRNRYKGPGLCPLRWRLWKERFGVVRDCEGVDEVSKRLAGESIEIMERIESEHGAGTSK